ncbi:hypothetical protein [Allorhizobium taibaishanense]|uniref:Class I SAM-dependent methyltransferase n=1 Tax=Allorhizobium taibaishanense TaxID=887144 RepID=A0A1Q9A640_9HYPH|nr:hypothetical protein [Allorhizobium taibaishanense]MBB4008834.1 hypothetical protein [Allorhizobium taibaishanense]OLP50054.1 hypothetical protein BJF91_11970 [Allorhizobium taibaishanense]
MIFEALNYAATRWMTSREHRPFIRYSINLWSRGRRCASAWAEHERNCNQVILKAASAITPRRTVVVLGSGLLRDVPVVALSRAFDTVVLVDLVHIASVRAWVAYKGLKNVRFIERDLSGYDALRTCEVPEPLDFLRRVPWLDLVVSANLLSQIGMGVKKRLAAETAPMPDDAVAQLIQAHIDGLKQVAASTCLITDISFEVIDRTGSVHEKTDLLAGVEPPPAVAGWDWPVAPLGEESKDYRIQHKVIYAACD